jgi:hypothetical protein
LAPDIISKAMDYWERIRGAHAMPRRSDLDPVDIPKLLPFVMLVDVLDGPRDFRFRLIGTGIEAIISDDYAGRRFSAIPHMTSRNKVWADYETVVNRRQSLTGAVDYVGADRYVRGIRHCLMPLSTDRKTVDMIFVAVEIDRR